MPAGVTENNQREATPAAGQRRRVNRLPRFVNRALVGYAVLMILAAWAFGLWHIYRERIDAYQRAERQLTTIAVGVSQHVEAMLNDGIGAARAAVNIIGSAQGLEGLDDAAVAAALRSTLTGGDYVKGLFIVSGERYVQAGRSGKDDVFGASPSWLETLPQAEFDRPWIGAPVPVLGTPESTLVPIAVRLQPANGPALWAGALFGIDSIQALYERQLFVDGVMALVSEEGYLLARVPAPPRGDYSLGEELTGALSDAIADGWQRSLEFVGPITNQPMVFMGRSVTGYPMASAVGLPKQVIFAPWVSQSRNTLAQLFAATLVIVLLTWVLRRSIEALKQRETQYRTLFDNAGVSVFLMDGSEFLEMNRKTCEMFRLPDDNALEHLTPWDISPPTQPGGESSERRAREYLAAAHKQGQISFRWMHRRMETLEDFPAEVSLSTLGGKSGLMLAIVHDLSDLERARTALVDLNADLERRVLERTRDLEQANLQLAMANQELESFTASASHDLRSPLGSISGMAGLLQVELAEGRTDTADRRLTRIQEGVKRMAEIIDGLLNLARMTSHEGHFEPVDLSELAAGIEAELRHQYPNHPVVTAFDPGLRVNADPRLMRTILSNLLGNAWKYTGKTAEPHVTLKRLLRDDGLYEYRLYDNGVGFDMRYAEKLFKPFRRLHTSDQFPGIGIGLATVARIIRRYGGQIWADSQLGRGTTFHFTLPNAHQPATKAADKSADAA